MRSLTTPPGHRIVGVPTRAVGSLDGTAIRTSVEDAACPECGGPQLHVEQRTGDRGWYEVALTCLRRCDRDEELRRAS